MCVPKLVVVQTIYLLAYLSFQQITDYQACEIFILITHCINCEAIFTIHSIQQW